MKEEHTNENHKYEFAHRKNHKFVTGLRAYRRHIDKEFNPEEHPEVTNKWLYDRLIEEGFRWNQIAKLWSTPPRFQNARKEVIGAEREITAEEYLENPDYLDGTVRGFSVVPGWRVKIIIRAIVDSD